MGIFLSAISLIAGIVSLVCFVMVLIRYYQQGDTNFVIISIILTFCCGIGPLVVFVKGWMDGFGNVMIYWSIAIVVQLVCSGGIAIFDPELLNPPGV